MLCVCRTINNKHIQCDTTVHYFQVHATHGSTQVFYPSSHPFTHPAEGTVNFSQGQGSGSSPTGTAKSSISVHMRLCGRSAMSWRCQPSQDAHAQESLLLSDNNDSRPGASNISRFSRLAFLFRELEPKPRTARVKEFLFSVCYCSVMASARSTSLMAG